MTITDTLMKATPMQQLCAALLVFALGASSGVAYTHSAQPTQSFDQFSYAAQDVQNMMKNVLDNPTEYNLRYANNNLIIVREQWAYGETGVNKELYLEYLKACEKVVNDAQEGKQVDTSNMNEMYLKLRGK